MKMCGFFFALFNLRGILFHCVRGEFGGKRRQRLLPPSPVALPPGCDLQRGQCRNWASQILGTFGNFLGFFARSSQILCSLLASPVGSATPGAGVACTLPGGAAEDQGSLAVSSNALIRGYSRYSMRRRRLHLISHWVSIPGIRRKSSFTPRSLPLTTSLAR